MRMYDILLHTPIGKRKGELKAKIENGTIDPDIVRLAVKGDGCSYYDIMGQLRKQGSHES